ncbi:GNAT family protein [Pseudaeromonas sp. ZJS20]|uniref:GNAT family N-acetyltransferase n=1 Tax=Pseudaeromonas aegiceratis TaxID=3153928 RepID=UPI00390C5A44
MLPITTSRLVIRPYQADDIAGQAEAVVESVDTVGQWLPWCTQDYSITDAVEWFVLCEKSLMFSRSYELGVFDKHSNALIGSVSINEVDKQNRRGNIGYWIRQSQQNKGYATEAVKAIVPFGFQVLDLLRLELFAAVENVASSTVAAKAGARFEGVAKNRIVLRGVVHDANVYSFIPDMRVA